MDLENLGHLSHCGYQPCVRTVCISGWHHHRSLTEDALQLRFFLVAPAWLAIPFIHNFSLRAFSCAISSSSNVSSLTYSSIIILPFKFYIRMLCPLLVSSALQPFLISPSLEQLHPTCLSYCSHQNQTWYRYLCISCKAPNVKLSGC